MAPKRARETLAGPEGSPVKEEVEEGSQSEQARREKSFDEMCKIYPLLAHKVERLAEQNPSFKSAFVRIDAETARSLEDQLESLREEELKIRMEAEETLSEVMQAFEEFDKDMERCKVCHGYLSFHNLHRQQVMLKKRGHGTLKDAQTAQ